MIKARYLSTIYTKKGLSGDSGYRIYRYCCIEGDNTITGGEEFTAGGYYLPASPIPVYSLHGVWSEAKNGKCFKVSSFSEDISRNKETIKKYLSSGIIKGLSYEYAEKITARFGNEALDILDTDPGKLFELRSIPIGTLLELKNEYEKERCIMPLLSWLSSFRIGERTVKKIYEKEGCASAKQTVMKAPYLLFRYGVPLPVCEKIAATLPLKSDYTGFETAVALNVLKTREGSGDVAMPREEFLREFSLILKDHKSRCNADAYLDKLLKEVRPLIVSVKDHLYRRETLRTENDVAKKVAFLAKTKPLAKVNFHLEKEIQAAEKRHGITLHENQRKAIITALSNSITVITGGPGTGKTTVVKIMREIYEKRMGKTMCFLAPTGRAAARMKESSGYEAYTIHKTLHISDETLLDDNEKMIEEDAVVCDEASMLDLFVARKLFGAVKPGHQIILLGDANQLPSVGTGKVLDDLINSKVVAVAELTRVYRQSSISRIFLNCQKIVKGNNSMEEGDDFEVIESRSFEDSAAKMVDAYLREVRNYGIDEVCCLCPFRRKTASGSIVLNNLLQEKVNPSKPGRNELKCRNVVFREGDRVMNRRNTADACNGDIGSIVKIEPSSRCVTVKFPQGILDYYYDDLEYLDLAYAMSIHKSQGSEFKCCITNLLPAHGIMLQMNLLNTAVSRAKEKFILIGSREAVKTAIATKDGVNRISALASKLQYAAARFKATVS